jgi:hypothetical protein
MAGWERSSVTYQGVGNTALAHYPLSEVVARARAARVAVHVVFRPTSQSRLEQHDSTGVLWIRPDLLLRELTTGTGGLLVTADVLSSTGLRDVFAGMLSGARDRGPGH